MNNETAKVILSAYRSDGADAQDPIFADALSQARLDPELSQWFEQQRGFDQRISQELKRIEVPVPPHDLLLAGAQAARRRNRPRPWLAWLAMAAVLVISGVLLVGPLGRGHRDNDAVSAFQQDALAMLSVQPAPKLDLVTSSLPETQAYIARQQGPLAPALPAALRDSNTAGCRVMEWRHHRISLTCFLLPDGRVVHLIVLPKSAIVGTRLPAAYQTVDNWHIAFRERDNRVMFWATRAPMDEFHKILQS